MESNKVLIDTSIVIQYLRTKKKAESQFIKLFQKNDLYISIIAIFELYNGATDDSKKNEFFENYCGIKISNKNSALRRV